MVALFAAGCQNTGESSSKVSGREQVNFGYDWEFRRLEDPEFPEGKWNSIFIPHIVREEPLIVNDQWQGISLYRKNFEYVPAPDRKWFLKFEGVMQEARLLINDSLVRVHKGGYLPFIVDMTPYLHQGKNLVEIRVINVDDSTIPPGKPLKELDFNYYGGIYRPISLIKTNSIYITDAMEASAEGKGGVLVHFSDVSRDTARGIIRTHVRNDGSSGKEIRLRVSFQGKGSPYSLDSDRFYLKAGRDTAIVLPLRIPAPNLWAPDHPELYQVGVTLLQAEKMIDSVGFRTGIRTIRLSDTAFYLNGKNIFLNGTNRHQEYPYIGYAISERANFRDAYKIKEAGFNMVRLSHYPQGPTFLEACDALGLLVMNCMPGWQYFGKEGFQARALQDIREMARRDRNHPSVVFWENSLNESPMTPEFIQKANLVLHEELPFPDTFSAGWIDHPAYDLFTPARQHAKPPHYWSRYDRPGRPLFIAEYGDWGYYAQNAGFNQTAFHDLQPEARTSRQLRGHGEKRLLQQALNFQESFNSNLKGEQTIGMANWLMFDYNRGYADDIEASGISDIFRIPKFTYYFYKSQKKAAPGPFSGPMVYIASYWTKDSFRKIRVFTNTEEVRLYLNGELIGTRAPERDRFSDELPHPPVHFELAEYIPGTLRAVGLVDGKEVADHVVSTPLEPEKIDLSIDISGKPIAQDAPDVIFVYAKVKDKQGTIIPDATNEIFFEIIGSGRGAEIIGRNPVPAEAGIATVLLRTKSLMEDITIRASAKGLGGAELIIEKQQP